MTAQGTFLVLFQSHDFILYSAYSIPHPVHCRRSGDKQQEGGGMTLQPSAVPSQVSDKQERAVI